MEAITAAQVSHFHAHGFFLIPNPFGEARMREIDGIARENEPRWESAAWPPGLNRLACQFLMVGEPLLQLVEAPEVVGAAERLLGCERVQVGACGLGDASAIIATDGRPNRQVHWHADGDPSVPQVSFRTALDRHDPANGPLRILPGSHLRPREEVGEELLQRELATGDHDALPRYLFARHPQEVEVILDPRWTLVWTPSCWHATGVKTAGGARRAFGWNYYPPGGRRRDLAAIKHVFAGAWEGWTEERKRLWGLID